MKKSVLFASAAVMVCYFTSCGGGKKSDEATAVIDSTTVEVGVPEYTLMNELPIVDLATFPKDAEGKVTLFDGKTLNGWRDYNRAEAPAAWQVADVRSISKARVMAKLVPRMAAIWCLLISLKTSNSNLNGK